MRAAAAASRPRPRRCATCARRACSRRRTPTSTGSTPPTSRRSTSSSPRSASRRGRCRSPRRSAARPTAPMLLQPWDLLDVVPRVAALKQARADGILVMPGNNLGYFGPEEAMLRSLAPDGRDHWQGCQAGRFVMGIESDGAVKGCPSLQTSHYVGGNVRERRSRRSGTTTPELAFARRAPSTICGASAARAPSPRPAWAAAPSPRTPSSAGRATTPTATTARARSPAADARAPRAQDGRAGHAVRQRALRRSSKSRSTRPIPARRRRRRW